MERKENSKRGEREKRGRKGKLDGKSRETLRERKARVGTGRVGEGNGK